MKVLLATIGLAVLVLCMVSPAEGQTQNLVVNGSFEADPCTGSGVGYKLGLVGTAVTGWVIPASDGTYPWCLQNANAFNAGPAASGNQWLVLGEVGTTTSRTVLQTLNGLTPGSTYTLSFAIASESGCCSVAEVSFPSGSSTAAQTFTAPASGNFWTAWATQTMNFTATSSSVTLQFKNLVSAQTNGGGIDLGLDNVDVESTTSRETHTVILGPPGTTTILTFNTDSWKITPINNNPTGGEQLTVTAFLVPKTSFPTGEGGLNGFSNETCTPYGDYSLAAGVDTCVEFQANCQLSATDTRPCNFLYLLATGYDLTGTTLATTGAGGNDFLAAHGANCPLTSHSMVQSIFLSYEATIKDPTTRGGSLGPTCYAATYTPGAPPITGGIASRFAGWESPVSNTELNLVKAGATRPLKFQFFDILGNPVTNLSFCNSLNSSGGCADIPAVPTPWVNLSVFGTACPNSTFVNTLTDGTLDFAGNSGLLNQGGGNYQLNWKTQKGWKGFCGNVVATFDSGLMVVPATVGFKFN